MKRSNRAKRYPSAQEKGLRRQSRGGSRINTKWFSEERFIKRTAVQLVLCSLIFLIAAAIKNLDSPIAEAIKSSITRTLTVSTNMEDIAVFFSDIGAGYDEIRNRAIEVFSNTGTKEEPPEEPPDEEKRLMAREMLLDSLDDSIVWRSIEKTAPETGEEAGNTEDESAEETGKTAGASAVFAPQSEPIVIKTYFEMPPSVDDLAEGLEDFDSGEIRTDITYLTGEVEQDIGIELAAPVKGRVTSEFGLRIHPTKGTEAFHYGVDLGAPKGSDIMAAYDGTVSEVGTSVAYGKYFVILHPNGVETFYGHCDKIMAKEGQEVKKGETVAKVGSTGWSTGPHLHFEVRKSGTVLDPMRYITLKSA